MNLRSTMKIGTLIFFISVAILMTLSNVGAERIKLLPDSLLARGEKLVTGGRDAVHGAERIKLLPDSLLGRGEKLVIGGREAVHGEFSFQVSLQLILDGGYSEGHICGGTILDKYTVLTAAHCFEETPSNVHFEIVAGSNILKGPHEEVQRRRIERIFIHPKYSQHSGPLAAINDIAVLRVRVPFIFNHYVSAARLPQEDVYPEGDVQVSGWGSNTYSGSTAEALQVLDLPLLPQEECAAWVLEGQHLKPGDWVNSLICTKPLSSHLIPYKGDSGGPLFQDEVVVGIVSTGETDSTLTMYTRVSAFRKWIDSKMPSRANSNSKIQNEL